MGLTCTCPPVVTSRSCPLVPCARRDNRQDDERKFPFADREAEFEGRYILEKTCPTVWAYERARGIDPTDGSGNPVHLWYPDAECPCIIWVGYYLDTDDPLGPWPVQACPASAAVHGGPWLTHLFTSWEEAEAWLLQGCEAAV